MSESPLVAEVEVKIALDAAEFAALPAALARLGFTLAGTETLRDYYLTFARSPHGGYDFLRLRAVGDDAFFRTEKRWDVDAGGHPLRLEDEHPLTAAEFTALLQAAVAPLSLCKRRSDFHGVVAGRPATVSLDCLELPRQTCYFLECEVMTPPAEAHAARAAVRAWMQAHLPVRSLAEAPSMLELLLTHAKGANDAGKR